MTISRGCPCLHTEPCRPSCTCVRPESSAGCLRCCSYGSAEQQADAARRIAFAVGARDERERRDQAFREGWFEGIDDAISAISGMDDSVHAVLSSLRDGHYDEAIRKALARRVRPREHGGGSDDGEDVE